MPLGLPIAEETPGKSEPGAVTQSLAEPHESGVANISDQREPLPTLHHRVKVFAVKEDHVMQILAGELLKSFPPLRDAFSKSQGPVNPSAQTGERTLRARRRKADVTLGVDDHCPLGEARNLLPDFAWNVTFGQS